MLSAGDTAMNKTDKIPALGVFGWGAQERERVNRPINLHRRKF